MTTDTIHVLSKFLDTVRASRNNTAIVDYDRSISYQDLEIRSAHVAALLTDRGVTSGQTVGIWGERSIELIVGLLAVMRAGGSCLPLDASYPADRLQFMLQDADASFVLVTDDAIATNPLGEIDTVRMSDARLREFDRKQVVIPAHHLDDDAYTLYTSGSTGKPKGVAMRHRSLAALIGWQIEQSNEVQGPTLQFAPVSFDVCFQEIFSTLCAARILVIVSEADRRDTRNLISILTSLSIARLFLPTSALQHLATAIRDGETLPALRQVIVAGEQLIVTPAIRRLFSLMPLCSLHNQYGPTETHVVTSYTLPGEPSTWPALPPIGTLLPHALGRIVGHTGEFGKEVGIGELLIGGACVARGYINRPRITSERFVSVVPYATTFYRTGDLVRREGNVFHFCGRIDDQVKVRGYRIEPAEVEAILTTHSDVASCVVNVDRSTPETPILVGYVVPQSASKQMLLHGRPIVRTVNPSWQDFLLSRLPEYMVPRVWVVLDTLPKTASGKIDRKSLPAIPTDRPTQSITHVTIRNRVDADLAKIWKELLNISDIGIDDRFFDLGGTSLHLVRMQALIADRLGVQCSVVDITSNPTVRSLARLISFGKDLSGSVAAPNVGKPHGAKHLAPKSAAIAIVGMSCRFPGADSPAQFWENLRGGVDSVTRSTQIGGTDDLEKFVFASASLRGIENFDSKYFAYSEYDAERLDPQHRLFLECSVEALEDASIDPDSSGLKIGVFGGCAPSTYLMNNLMSEASSDADRTLVLSSLGLQLLIASDKDFLVSRVSYKLNLRGPSVSVNSACATSLFAAHLACGSIRNGECDVALAGAAFVLSPQIGGHAYEPGMVFSPDGFCRAYSAEANGAVFGEGVALVVLRPLEDALVAGDRIYAVIEGSAINNDGSMKVGMAAPSVNGQIDVISQAQRNASVSPYDITYVEGHGTATKIGDSIEISALDAVFGESTAPWCGIGSVKTNIGHLGWASGMAGLIKTALAIHHKELPPTLHCTTPNDHISSCRSAFSAIKSLTPWVVASGRRVAGVSAFGLGGANAHMILAESTQRRIESLVDGKALIFPLSAATPTGLRRVAKQYKEHLQKNVDVSLSEVSATLCLGRRKLPHRKALIARNRDQLISLLEAVESDGDIVSYSKNSASRSKVVALFTGQGMEYCGMGVGLYETWPAFKALVDSSDPIFLEHFGKRAVTLLRDEREFKRISRIQPLTFVLQMGLVELLSSWGVKLDIVLGHSLGEFAAACTAGVFTFDDGLELVVERGKLLESLPCNSGMLSVFLPSAEVEQLIASTDAKIDIAACNSPANTIVSGLLTDLSLLTDEMSKRGIRSRTLNVSRAGHSRQLDPILDAFENTVSKISLRTPQLELISNLHGHVVHEEVRQPTYWRRHLRETVRFVDGVRAAADIGNANFLEIGPGSGLLSLAASTLPEHKGRFITSLQRDSDESESVLRAFAALFEVGQSLNWVSAIAEKTSRAPLPTYPFEQIRHWITPSKTGSHDPRKDNSSSLARLAYTISWREHSIADRLTNTSDAIIWLVITMNDSDALGLTEALRRRGHECVLFIVDRQILCRTSTCTTSIDTDWQRAVVDLSERLRAVLPSQTFRVVLVCDDSALRKVDVSIDGIEQTCGTALAVVQALIMISADFCELCLITSGAQAFQQRRRAFALCESPLLGLKRTFALEYPLIRTVSLDLHSYDQHTLDVAAFALSSELVEDELIAIDGGLLVPRLVGLDLVAARPQLEESSAYLITGGFSGVAIQCAKLLVECGAKHLILAGRSGANPAAAAAIAELCDQGVTIVQHKIDVSDHLQVCQLIDSILLSRRLAGILHCSAIIDDSTIMQQTWARFANVLQPKALGAWHLHQATVNRGVQLDFFVLFSSSSSLLGDDGQANHAAACTFLDEFAIYRRALGLAATSINWGAWGEDGFYARRPDLLRRIVLSNGGFLNRQQAAMALLAALCTDTPRIAILPQNWPQFVRRLNGHVPPLLANLVQPIEASVAAQHAAHEVAASTAEARLELTIRHLRRILRSIQDGSEREESALGSSMSWANRGVDSLQMIRMVNAIQREFQCRISSRMVQESLGLADLAAQLIAQVFTDQWGIRVLGADVAEPPKQYKPVSHRFELSAQQIRWLSLITDANYGHRVVPIVFHSALNLNAFSHALRNVVERHEILRYVYDSKGVKLLSTDDVMSRQHPLFVDLKNIDAAGAQIALREQVARCLGSLPLPTLDISWRTICIDWATEKFVVLLGLQHIDFDGTSLSTFVNELRENYLSLVTKGELAKLQEPVQYKEYVAAQKSYVENGMEADKAFFEGLLMRVPSTTSLPNHPGYAVTTAQLSKRYTPSSGLADWADILDLATALGVSPFAIVFASYARMLHEVLDVSPIVIGVVVSGRIEERFARTIGPFSNHVPVPISDILSDDELLIKSCHNIVSAVSARGMFVPSVLTKLSPAFTNFPPDTYFSDVCINFLNYQREATTPDLRVEVLEILGPTDALAFDSSDFSVLRRIPGLHLVVDVNKGVLRGNYWYHSARFAEHEVVAWADCQRRCLQKMLNRIKYGMG